MLNYGQEQQMHTDHVLQYHLNHFKSHPIGDAELDIWCRHVESKTTGSEEMLLIVGEVDMAGPNA